MSDCTEQQAATRWCPFGRHMVTVERNGEPHLTAGGINRYSDQRNGRPGTFIGNCIGSQCMAWRTSEGDNYTGYCGLAGKP